MCLSRLAVVGSCCFGRLSSAYINHSDGFSLAVDGCLDCWRALRGSVHVNTVRSWSQIEKNFHSS